MNENKPLESLVSLVLTGQKRTASKISKALNKPFVLRLFASMQFKLGNTFLKGPSTFLSGRRTARPSQTCRGKGSVAVWSYPYTALSRLWFTLLLCCFSFPQTNSTEGCQPESDCWLWASWARQSFTHSLQGAQCCFAYQTMSQQIFISCIQRLI